ncbi:peptidoglycan DD-metalloendopeptidase family protein [Nonomuraea typhae]|uniref:peptidoglycan DD-metalloendopeptidase family protein n=1 Tax=Nonomuraea typhae TaxID=2603600 RepID=UPI0012FB6369|nr:peptidase inhibitor family I36 protein [Nonomuraea typhae]
MSMSRRILAGASVVLALGAMVVAASPAVAGGRDGVCDDGEFCYYFNSGNQGSVSDFAGSVSNYASTQPSCYDFKGPGAGQGTCVKNAAASVWNRSRQVVRVFYNSGHAGTHQDFGPGVKGNLIPALKNQNASHEFNPGATPARGRMSYALYAAHGSISCPFDGYTTRPGSRHEGIDLVRRLGAEVRSLVDGEIVNVQRGRTGSGGLSTIAIYVAAANKTVIYLHSSPSPSLRAGQRVSRGQIIATESWRGVGESSSAHTHVEMRPGRHLRAAKSIGDRNLENPDPTSFWNSQGYQVR